MPPVILTYDKSKAVTLAPVTSTNGAGATAGTKQSAAATIPTKRLNVAVKGTTAVKAGLASAATGADAAFEGYFEWDQQPGSAVNFAIAFTYDISGAANLGGGPGAAKTIPGLPTISGTAGSHCFLGVYIEIMDRVAGTAIATLKDDYFSDYTAFGSLNKSIRRTAKVTTIKFTLQRGKEYFWRFTHYARIGTGTAGIAAATSANARSIVTLQNVAVTPGSLYPIPFS